MLALLVLTPSLAEVLAVAERLDLRDLTISWPVALFSRQPAPAGATRLLPGAHRH